ncbi:6862_t:CDS:2 [Entrophospora sp. SA101]|nr:5214_t:CDS:2 [Entrophospora sp. SA101]CAJ0857853.1 6862_t:CDS:2 [Entrophospora sp. SA101]
MPINSLHQKTSQRSFEPLFYNDNDNKSTTDSISTDGDDEINFDIICDEFKFINGRMFVNLENSCQVVAVDEKSISNMEILEILYEHVWGGKFSAPVQNELNNMCVLDIGCGSGSWIASVAELYPKSTFIGIDIMDFKREDLPNLAFIKSNIFDGLPFPDNTFDYVHQSNMMLSIRKDKWPFIIDEIIRERDPRSTSLGPVMDKISKSFVAYLKVCGINTKINKELESMLLGTNKIVDIGVNSKGIPLGSWGGYIGELFLKNITELLSARISSILDFMCMTEKDLKEIMEIAPLEYNKHKSYAKTYRIYGRKI